MTLYAKKGNISPAAHHQLTGGSTKHNSGPQVSILEVWGEICGWPLVNRFRKIASNEILDGFLR